ncbi:unnamed protein product [Rodentolepis nana]|uniref:Uncharacterized protein n=1 Tax=Rodentolepis nana TaxID=102285 RepID=A0A0R3U013_RODNA|nr:unnamed protein product [Rodentolepis nana]
MAHRRQMKVRAVGLEKVSIIRSRNDFPFGRSQSTTLRYIYIQRAATSYAKDPTHI